jgi:hypothetical protein
MNKNTDPLEIDIHEIKVLEIKIRNLLEYVENYACESASAKMLAHDHLKTLIFYANLLQNVHSDYYGGRITPDEQDIFVELATTITRAEIKLKSI